jgi:hypothetical protein
MKMSLDEYNEYLRQLQQPPESKEMVVEKKITAKKTVPKPLKRKTYKKSR